MVSEDFRWMEAAGSGARCWRFVRWLISIESVASFTCLSPLTADSRGLPCTMEPKTIVVVLQ